MKKLDPMKFIIYAAQSHVQVIFRSILKDI